MDTKDKIIVYVFGPARTFRKYMSNAILDKENGEWIKIGLAHASKLDDNPFEVALNRCRREPHTGIPETCLIYDVFEFPYLPGKMDDEIRKVLTSYNIESSKINNKAVASDQIPAGDEFVYGVNRQQVYNAVHAYQSILLTMFRRDKKTTLIELLLDLMVSNDNKSLLYDMELEDTNEDNVSRTISACNFDFSFVQSLISKLPSEIQNDASYRKDIQSYGCSIKLMKNGGVWIKSQYSPRGKCLVARVCTKDYETYKDIIASKLKSVNFSGQTREEVGSRNRNWHHWFYSQDVKESPDKEIDWLVEATKGLYNALKGI